MFGRRPAAVIFAPRAKCSVGYGWSVRSEYLYVDFDSYTTFTSGPFSVGILGPREVKLTDHIWRAGMNYKFW
jgi:opacity protein-like surface antigen